jgi:hypothetical protein
MSRWFEKESDIVGRIHILRKDHNRKLSIELNGKGDMLLSFNATQTPNLGSVTSVEDIMSPFLLSVLVCILYRDRDMT